MVCLTASIGEPDDTTSLIPEDLSPTCSTKSAIEEGGDILLGGGGASVLV